MFHLQKNILKIFITPHPLRLVWMFQVESILGGISAALCCGEFSRAARKSGADSKPLHRSPDVHLVMVRSEKKAYSVTVARTPIAPPEVLCEIFEPQRFLRRTPLLHQISWRYFFPYTTATPAIFWWNRVFLLKINLQNHVVWYFFLLFTTMMGPRFFGGEQKCLKWMHWSIWDLNPLIMGFYSLHPWNST